MFLTGLVTHQMGVRRIGPATAASQAVSILAPLLFGPAVDRFGLKAAAAVVLATNAGALGLALAVNRWPSDVGWDGALSALCFADGAGARGMRNFFGHNLCNSALPYAAVHCHGSMS